MHSRYLRMTLLVLIAVCLAVPSFAARRSSLGGNLLIKDTDEIFFFPHRVGEYNRLVTFDFGTESRYGSGGMIFGDNSLTFGAFTHRGDFIGAMPHAFTGTGDIDHIMSGGRSSFGGFLTGVGPSEGSLQWWDFVVGWEAGENPIGARISVGRNNDDPPADNENADVTSVNIILGTEINDIDLAAEFSVASATTESGGTTTDITPVGFSVAARKTATEDSEDLQFGWLGDFSFVTGSRDVSNGTSTSTDMSEMLIVAGFGPVYQPHDRTVVAMYGTFEYMRSNSDDGTTDSTDQSFVIPGWHVGAEVEISSWLQARAGLQSRFSFDSSDDDTATTSSSSDSNSLDFSWHTGLGVQFDNFMVDLYLHPDVITSGTDVLGDNSQAFGMVTASMKF